MADPRPVSDEETAHLLPDTHENDASTPPSFLDRIGAILQEPLTPLTQLLLVAALILLLLCSVFVGLFAGMTHKLNLEKGKNPGEKTMTLTTTSVATNTVTDTATTTWSTTTTTTATTTTTTTTTGLPVPIPVPTTPPIELCTTRECIVQAASIISSLDPSKDPCEEFYQFANGGWLKSHFIPSDKDAVGSYLGLSLKNGQVIREILQPDYHPPSSSRDLSSLEIDYDSLILSKLRALYRSCFDEKHSGFLGKSPLMHVVRNIRKLFWEKGTVIGPEEDEAAITQLKGNGLTAAVAYLHSRGIDTLFDYEIEGDVGVDPNLLTLWFKQPSLGLPSKEYYKDDTTVQLYRKTLERLLLTLSELEDAGKDDDPQESNGSDTNILQINNAAGTESWPPWPWPPWDGDDGDNDDKDEPLNRTERARKLAKQVLEFETKIADASSDIREIMGGDPFATYNPRPLSNLSETLPQIHFSDYISTFNPRSFPSKVIVAHPDFFASLASLLESTTNSTVEAYLVVRAALRLAPLLSAETEAWQAVRALDEHVKGIKKGAVQDRAEFCVERVEDTLGFAAGRYFVREKFPGKSREKGTEIIANVVKAFKASLAHLEWMDEDDAVLAAKKANAIRVKVGYPLYPDTRSASSIYRYYALVKIRDDAFFSNILSAATIDVSRKWLGLGRKRNPEIWHMYPSTVNAYFEPAANEIVFPAGILQPPFFSQGWPGYVSYGAFGAVAAHELTHAFDSSGRLFDQHGKLEKWWSNTTSEGYKVREDCIVKQYSEYTVDDGKGGKLHVKGNMTSGENIGDSGLIQSYRAWKAQFNESFHAGNEFLLPGLNFTKEQLFFISFAQIWAEKRTPASAVHRVLTDPHSPKIYRVEGTVSNVPEFAKAFNCPKGAKLNPPDEKRCLFW